MELLVLKLYQHASCSLISEKAYGIELTIAKTIEHPDLIIIGIYRSPRVVLSSLLTAIRTTLEENPSSRVIFMGDFNLN